MADVFDYTIHVKCADGKVFGISRMLTKVENLNWKQIQNVENGHFLNTLFILSMSEAEQKLEASSFFGVVSVAVCSRTTFLLVLALNAKMVSMQLLTYFLIPFDFIQKHESLFYTATLKTYIATSIDILAGKDDSISESLYVKLKLLEKVVVVKQEANASEIEHWSSSHLDSSKVADNINSTAAQPKNVIEMQPSEKDSDNGTTSQTLPASDGKNRTRKKSDKTCDDHHYCTPAHETVGVNTAFFNSGNQLSDRFTYSSDSPKPQYSSPHVATQDNACNDEEVQQISSSKRPSSSNQTLSSRHMESVSSGVGQHSKSKQNGNYTEDSSSDESSEETPKRPLSRPHHTSELSSRSSESGKVTTQRKACSKTPVPSNQTMSSRQMESVSSRVGQQSRTTQDGNYTEDSSSDESSKETPKRPLSRPHHTSELSSRSSESGKVSTQRKASSKTPVPSNQTMSSRQMESVSSRVGQQSRTTQDGNYTEDSSSDESSEETPKRPSSSSIKTKRHKT